MKDMALMLENQLEIFSNANPLSKLESSTPNEDNETVASSEEDGETSADETKLVGTRRKSSKRMILSDSESEKDDENEQDSQAMVQENTASQTDTALPLENTVETENEESIPNKNISITKSHRRTKKSININELRQKYRNMESDADLQENDINLKEMFSDNSSDEEALDNQRNDLQDEVSLDNILPGGKRRKKLKKPKKAAVAEMESEQQRLVRDASIKIPYHVPEAKSVKHFLQRVPDIKSSYIKQSEVVKDERLQSTPTQSLLSKVFLSTPTLASANDFDDEALSIMPADSEDNQELDKFMNKLKKHTKSSESNSATARRLQTTTKATNETAENKLITFESVKTAKTPGSRLEALKGELKSKISEERKHQRLMIESQQQIDDEDFSAEETDEGSDNDDDDDDDDGDDDILKSKIKMDTPEKLKTFGQASGRHSSQITPLKGPAEREIDIMQATDDTQDIEVEKWNMVDARTQLERELSRDKFDERDKVDALAIIKTDAVQTTGLNPDGSSSALSNSVTSDDSGKPDLMETESSIHPWQPIAMHFQPSDNNDISASNQDMLSTDNNDENTIDGSVPFGNTALPTFGNESIISSMPMQQAQQAQSAPILHDEDAQFTQILDTQGFLKPVPVSRPYSTKSKTNGTPFQSISDALRLCSKPSNNLKSTDMLPTDTHDNSESQDLDHALQFCSGKFQSTGDQVKKPFSLFSLPVNSTTQDSDELLGLCSGKFSDSPTQPKQDCGIHLPIDKETTQNDDEILGLCSGKFDKSPPHSKRSLFSLITSPNPTQNDDELLGLCSGKFPDSTQTQNKYNHPCKGLPVDVETTQKEDELIGLCSGVFPSDTVAKRDAKPTTDQVEHIETDAALEDPDSEGDIIFSIKRMERKTINVGSDDEDDNDGIGHDDDDDDSASVATVPIDSEGEEIEPDLTNAMPSAPTRLNRNDFVEEEAELSGSEAGSDEDEDLGSEFDEYEEDSEVEDLPSHEELKNQVNKVHMKSVLDEDKREIRRYQEMFFEDGDLHSDGQGRRRNFRWKHIDDFNFSPALGNDDSNDEADGAELLNTSDQMAGQGNTRKQRFERETFMQEKEPCIMHLDEDSQSILNLIKDTSHLSPPVDHSEDSQSIVSTKRAGSFLSRSKTSLFRLSSVTAQNVKAKRAAFVFQSVSPTKDDAQSNQGGNQAQRRSNSSGPATKRRCIDRTSSTPTTTSKSIFSHLI